MKRSIAMTIAIPHHPSRNRATITLVATVAALLLSLALVVSLATGSSVGPNQTPAVATVADGSVGPNVGLAPGWSIDQRSTGGGPNAGLAPRWIGDSVSSGAGPNAGLAPNWTAGS